jgi:hypothetical protein
MKFEIDGHVVQVAGIDTSHAPDLYVLVRVGPKTVWTVAEGALSATHAYVYPSNAATVSPMMQQPGVVPPTIPAPNVLAGEQARGRLITFVDAWDDADEANGGDIREVINEFLRRPDSWQTIRILGGVHQSFEAAGVDAEAIPDMAGLFLTLASFSGGVPEDIQAMAIVTAADREKEGPPP